MLVILIVLNSFQTASSQNLNCVDAACLSCTSGYNYCNTSCLHQCPTRFSLIESSCLSTSTDKSLYSVQFSYETNFTKSCIGVFCHPLGLAFNDSARLSPITTIDRGLYFASTSKLTSTPGWVLAPDISFAMHIRITSDGTIFEAVLSQLIVLKIQATFPNLAATILQYSSGNYLASTISVAYTNTWTSFVFVHAQSQGLSTLTLGTATITKINHEFRMQDSTISYYFGSSLSTSFQGFLYKVSFRNSNSSELIGYYLNVGCGYNSYLSGSACVQCGSGCPTWPWCISASCSICYSANCESCNGYSYNDCYKCSNGKVAPGCDTGRYCNAQTSTYGCTTCSGSYELINGICVNKPYGYPNGSSPVLNIKFNTFDQYYGGVFQSGSNQNTWGPFNSSDADDPIPLKGRGLYFDGIGTYLKATGLNLSPTSTIAIWLCTMNSKTLYQTNYVGIYGNFDVVYVMYNAAGKEYIYRSDSPCPPYNTWVFAVTSIKLNSGLSTMTVTMQSIQYTSASIDGYALYDIPSQANIGLAYAGSGGAYKGFIYSFTIWQYYQPDLLSHSNICGISLITSCLSNCQLADYFNVYQGVCLPCDSTCTKGCLSWGTCQKCTDIKCNTCADYVSTCTQSNSAPCIAPLVYSSGNCCTNACLTCYGRYNIQCLTCNSGKFLLGTVCVAVCPIFYTQSNGICTKTISNVISIVLDKIQDSYTDFVSGIVLSTGIDSDFYPTLKPSDPIPAKNRGYYFLATSYMSTTSFILNYNYTLNFWLKHMQPGMLFQKGSLTFSTSMQFISSYFSFSNAGCINNTNWMLLTLQFTTNYQGVFSYYLTSSLYSIPIASGSANNRMLDTDSSAIILGSSSASFRGFLYRFDLTDYDPGVLNFIYTICSGLIDTSCLWNCDIQQFYENSGCAACNSTCTQGCVRANDCNLCNNSICAKCSNFGAGCDTCSPSLTVNQSACQCNDGYYWFYVTYSPYNLDCVPCDGSCYSCYRDKYYTCIKCKSLALEVICLASCPLGYYMDNDKCALASNPLALKFTFDTISGVYIDSIYGIMALTGMNESFYPDLDSSDPIPAQFRGIYFNGQGSFLSLPYNSTGIQLIGLRAFFSFWINPVNALSTFFSLYDSTNTFLQISILSSHPKVSIYVDSEIYTCTHTSSSTISEWNHLLVSVDYNAVSQLSIILNRASSTILSISEAPFIIPQQSKITIGSNSLSGNYFQGFLYTFEIYTVSPDLNLLAISPCTGCSVCLQDSICISDCDIFSFFDENIQNCLPCLSSCSTGCRNSNDCNICNDTNCRLCFGFDANQCFECSSGFVLVDQVCTVCGIGSYYDMISKKCLQCGSLCISCSAGNSCDLCKPNSTYNSLTSSCVCNIGFYYNVSSNSCEQCEVLCQECSQSNTCTKCMNSSSLDATQKCVCNTGYYYDTNLIGCAKCDILCESCSAKIKCDKCESNSLLNSIYKCVCSSGYYFDVNSTTCKTCEDLCESCSERNLCDKCMQNSHLNLFAHCECDVGFYYSETLHECIKCIVLCESCSAENECTQCMNNSHLDPTSKCVCDLGYNESSTTCVKSNFMVYYDLSINNDVTLLFSEPLLTSLTADDIQITLNNSIVLFTLQELDLQRYIITLNLLIIRSEVLVISLKKTLISINNSVLSVNSLTINLHYSTVAKIASEINQLQSYSQTGATVALSAAVGGSVINLNPNSLFTFLNCLEIYRYTILFDLDFEIEFIQFLTNLQSTSMFPNILAYFISESNGEPLSGKFVYFGYNSNLILINSGLSISILLFFIVLAPITYGIKFFSRGWLKNKLVYVANKFKFFIFLRLFIQMFLEILLSSCIGILYTNFENRIQVLDFVICSIFLTAGLFGTLLIFLLIKARENISNKEEFLKRFGLLFEEMQDKKTSGRLFYLIYLIRRIFIVLTTFFIRIPVVQLSLNATMSLGVSMYLMCARPFKDKVVENYLICNEILTTIFLCVLAASFVTGSGIDKKGSYIICIKILLASLACNFMANISNSVKSIIKFIRSRKKTNIQLPDIIETGGSINSSSMLKQNKK